MQIAIMSDSHDNIWNLRKALSLISDAGAELIVHCGDFVAPFVLKELDQAGVPVHGVFGNNDGDQYLLTKLTYTRISQVTLHGPVGQLEVGGARICFTHEPVFAKGLASENKYHLVCYGHTHEYRLRIINDTLLLNPGEIMGKEGHPGFCLYDTARRQVDRITLDAA